MIAKSEVYQAYRNYCLKLKIKIVSLTTVSHQLPTFINTHGEKQKINNKSVRVWRDITIKGYTEKEGSTLCPISSPVGGCVKNDTLITDTKESTKWNRAKDHAKDEDDKPESKLTTWLKSVKAVKEEQ